MESAVRSRKHDELACKEKAIPATGNSLEKTFMMMVV
jgi:hypothetical protein